MLRHRTVSIPKRLLFRHFSAVSSADGMEFTISPYVDVPSLGFQKSDKFCMLTLKFPAFQGMPLEQRHAMYEQKRKRRSEFVEMLFDHYDANGSGYLCKALWVVEMALEMMAG